MTKKRYMYKSCGEDGVIGDKIGKRGVLLARRDCSVFIRNFYEQIIMKIFNDEHRDDILYFIIQTFNKLFSNSIPYKEFIITKAVGNVNIDPKTNTITPCEFIDPKDKKKKIKIGDYIVPILPSDEKQKLSQLKKKDASSAQEYYEKCLPAQVQLAEKMRRRGTPVQSGSRLEYVVTDIENHLGKQYEKAESYDYFIAHSNILSIDFFYYLKNAINSVDEILNIAFDNNDKKYQYKYKKDFILDQYNFRFKIRQKVLNDIKNLFKPKIIFK